MFVKDFFFCNVSTVALPTIYCPNLKKPDLLIELIILQSVHYQVAEWLHIQHSLECKNLKYKNRKKHRNMIGWRM
jgi:hypothetical protein